MRFYWQKIQWEFIKLTVVSTIVAPRMNTNDLMRIWETDNKHKMLCGLYAKRLLNHPRHSQVGMLAFWRSSPDKNSRIFIDQLGFAESYAEPPEVAWKKCKSWSFQLKSKSEALLTTRGAGAGAAWLGGLPGTSQEQHLFMLRCN